ncbi:hypothetical protein B0H66DRAFT_627465 [Apodospora peruviana]|uniref:Uncharacterized protein n=1 Tax=Apodospora peruviana TaxID=516989 RepID=A0AAE0HYA6_9PEZI|nr:hypothetical protein B0H66DRAFT_627465 [Apodospora peruviana]
MSARKKGDTSPGHDPGWTTSTSGGSSRGGANLFSPSANDSSVERGQSVLPGVVRGVRGGRSASGMPQHAMATPPPKFDLLARISEESSQGTGGNKSSHHSTAGASSTRRESGYPQSSHEAREYVTPQNKRIQSTSTSRNVTPQHQSTRSFSSSQSSERQLALQDPDSPPYCHDTKAPGHEGEKSPDTSPLQAVLNKHMKYLGDTSKKAETMHPELVTIHNNAAISHGRIYGLYTSAPQAFREKLDADLVEVVTREMESIRSGESMAKEIANEKADAARMRLELEHLKDLVDKQAAHFNESLEVGESKINDLVHKLKAREREIRERDENKKVTHNHQVANYQRIIDQQSRTIQQQENTISMLKDQVNNKRNIWLSVHTPEEHALALEMANQPVAYSGTHQLPANIQIPGQTPTGSLRSAASTMSLSRTPKTALRPTAQQFQQQVLSASRSDERLRAASSQQYTPSRAHERQPSGAFLNPQSGLRTHERQPSGVFQNTPSGPRGHERVASGAIQQSQQYIPTGPRSQDRPPSGLYHQQQFTASGPRSHERPRGPAYQPQHQSTLSGSRSIERLGSGPAGGQDRFGAHGSRAAIFAPGAFSTGSPVSSNTPPTGAFMSLNISGIDSKHKELIEYWDQEFKKFRSTANTFAQKFYKSGTPEGIVDTLKKKHPEVWGHLLETLCPNDTITSAAKYVEYLLTDATTLPFLVERIITQEIVTNVLGIKAWTRWNDEHDAEMKDIALKLNNPDHFKTHERQSLVDRAAGIIEGRASSKSWPERLHTAQQASFVRAKQLAGPLIPAGVKTRDARPSPGEVFYDLYDLVRAGWELSSRVWRSRLTFHFSWPEQQRSGAAGPAGMAVISSEIHEVVGRGAGDAGGSVGERVVRGGEGPTAIKLVVTPLVTMRDDSGLGIKTYQVTRAGVFPK